MLTFTIIWFGQLVSTLGSSLTGFALGVWIYQQTSSVMLFAVNTFIYMGTTVLVSPFAGALVDRWNRRLVMILSDTGAGLTTLAVWFLLLADNLQIWHIFLLGALNSAFTAFQFPAYSAATTMLVPRQQLGRAGGMVQIGEAIAQLASPAIAGALFLAHGLKSIVLIDFATFLVAVTSLVLIQIPEPVRDPTHLQQQPSILKDINFGWRYIADRKGLLYWMLFIASLNFAFGMYGPLMTPLMLELGNAQQVGLTSSVVGLGMLVGTLVMSIWGGPQKRFTAVLGSSIWMGLCTMILGAQPSLVLIGISGFLSMLVLPILNASSRAMWQTKIPPDIQGRVFSVRRVIGQFTAPIAALLAGPLVDKAFQPWMEPDGILAANIGLVIGTGPGRGTALAFILIGLMILLFSFIAGTNPTLRQVEMAIPDAEITIK
jgi:DHA3 family macrolide efflux protein-like MFS transporter